MNCPFMAPGRDEACRSLQQQRLRAMKREYDPNECFACPMRRKRLEGEKPPARINIPPGSIDGRTPSRKKPMGIGRVIWDDDPKPEPNVPKEVVAVEGTKEKILAVITRIGPCKGTPILQRAIAGADLKRFGPELAQEGKIKMWPWRGTFFYTLPDAADPRPDPGNGKEPIIRKRSPQKVERKPPPAESVPSNGTGSFAAAIEELKRRRDRIDFAIQELEALG